MWGQERPQTFPDREVWPPFSPEGGATLRIDDADSFLKARRAAKMHTIAARVSPIDSRKDADVRRSTAVGDRDPARGQVDRLHRRERDRGLFVPADPESVFRCARMVGDTRDHVLSSLRVSRAQIRPDSTERSRL